MEQFHNDVINQEKKQQEVVKKSIEKENESPLLKKVRQNFIFFGGISLIFGVTFTWLFYKAWLGVNVLLFSAIIVLLLSLVMKKLGLTLKKGTVACYIAVLLLGISTVLTFSDVLQFFNIIGILLLLDLSLLHQMNDDSKWDLIYHLGKIFSLVFYSIIYIGNPFTDCYELIKKSKLSKHKKIKDVLVGIIISVPILLAMAGLLSSADLMFGRLTHNIFDFIFSSNLIEVSIMLIIGVVACYSIIYGAIYSRSEQKERKKADATIIVTILSLLCIMYLLFSGIQIFYLFSNGLLELPREFTFAEYARRGFFELLTVTVLNIIIMLISTTFFQQNKFLKILLTLITICTYIMIASAVYRMLLYIGAYHLTFLRLFVLLFLLIDVFVLAGVIIKVYKEKFPLFYYSTIVVSVFYIIFSLSKPDYIIASYLVKNENELEFTDLEYLTRELSLDATPVVLDYINEHKNGRFYIFENEPKGSQIVVRNYFDRIESFKMGIRDFNLSHYKAKNALKIIN